MFSWSEFILGVAVGASQLGLGSPVDEERVGLADANADGNNAKRAYSWPKSRLSEVVWFDETAIVRATVASVVGRLGSLKQAGVSIGRKEENSIGGVVPIETVARFGGVWKDTAATQCLTSSANRPTAIATGRSSISNSAF